MIIHCILCVITDKSGLPEYSRKNWCNNCSEIEGEKEITKGKSFPIFSIFLNRIVQRF